MISVPVMSLGIRSGVNWMRWNFRCNAWASVEMVSVFAKPGTPIVRQFPRAKMQISICSIISSCPMMTLCTSLTSASRAWATRRTASSGLIWGAAAGMEILECDVRRLSLRERCAAFAERKATIWDHEQISSEKRIPLL